MKKYKKISLFVWALFLIHMLARMVYAEVPISEAVLTIAKVLPQGWSIVEQKTGEIPWGHHWCDKYGGVTGTKIVVRGKSPARSRFLGVNDEWRDVVVGAEALDIWIMPRDYRDSRLAWFCFHRPIQPTPVLKNQNIQIYARPSHHSTAEEKITFDKELAKAKAVESPESPWNDPSKISWRTWQSEINAAEAGIFGH